MNVLEKLKKEWFLVGMVVAIALATVSSDVGKSGGWIHLNQLTGIGVAIVFFSTRFGAFSSGNQSGHDQLASSLVHSSVDFVVYPLLVGHLWWSIYGVYASGFGVWFFICSVLPSTISSSVAMTSVGKGNVPGAIFNASLSSIIGVVITVPYSAFMGVEGVEARSHGFCSFHRQIVVFTNDCWTKSYVHTLLTGLLNTKVL